MNNPKKDPIGKGVSGNAMSPTGPAQPDEIDRPEGEEAKEANLELEQAFNSDATQPVPPGSQKVGGLRGSSD